MTDQTRLVPLSALEEIRDLLAERIHGNPARSAGHNARLAVEGLLAAAPPPQQGDMRERIIERIMLHPATDDLTAEQAEHLAEDILGDLSLIQPAPAPAIDADYAADLIKALRWVGEYEAVGGSMNFRGEIKTGRKIIEIAANQLERLALIPSPAGGALYQTPDSDKTGGAVDTKVQALAAQVERLETAVKKAAGWFDEYEAMHAAKGNLDGDRKARCNAGRAADLRSALSGGE